MGVERFEELIAWQKARELTNQIYRATRQQSFMRDYGLSNQMQRAAVSTMANIAEGFERMNPGEFHQFLVIAKASCGELRSHLYVALDNTYLTRPEFDSLFGLCDETGRLIGALRVAVEKQRKL